MSEWLIELLSWAVQSLRWVGESVYQSVGGKSLSVFIDGISLLVVFLMAFGILDWIRKLLIPLFHKRKVPQKLFEKLVLSLSARIRRFITLSKLSVAAAAFLITVAWIAGIYLHDIGIPTVQEFQIKKATVVSSESQSPSSDSPTPESRAREALGQMGDFFGGMLNPILAFASFIALLYTIRIQSEELRLTKDELSRSADAHEKAEANMREQIRLAKQQNEMQFHHTVLSNIESRLHELLNAQLHPGNPPLEPFKKISRVCVSLIVADKSSIRAIGYYNQIEEQDYRLKEVRYEVVLLFARLTHALHDYHNRFGQTAVSFDYIIQYVELAAILHALKIINAREGAFQIYNIDEFYESSGFPSGL